MATITRRKMLAATGATTVAGVTALFGDDKKDKKVNKPQPPYHFRDVSPRELIRERHLPNVELITMDGKKVHFYDDLVKNRRVVIQFMFTRCEDVCPMITHHMVEVKGLLNGRVGHDIFFYSITLSPEEDSPKDLRLFAKSHGANWLFLTGKAEDILLLRKSLGFFYNNPKEDADRNNHSGMLVVGDEPLMRWAMCQGGADPDWIATVIRTEADAPFKGVVNGTKQADPAVHVK